MELIRKTKDNISQISALVEKNVKLQLRYKFGLVTSFTISIVSILMPLIIMGNLFQTRPQIGNWNSTNFVIYQFLAYNIFLMRDMTSIFPQQFRQEKYWKTLPALIIGPFNRLNLLLGIFLSHLIVISVPFITFFLLGLFFYPISFITAMFLIILFFIVALVLSGIGLILGIFAISNENIWRILNFLLYFVFWFSCITYPYEIFPQFIQNIINLNPLYYLFDILRLTWIQDNIIITILTYPFHFILLFLLAVLLPLIGIYIFNLIYKKYGITGY
ncbi:MAG: hypothetical protein GF317_14510 [Candidatus Lokiarchaeota archaeon]|nr:hypothetical protein [Candidatus Lokiarchaeota archaeon]MBD3200819.1 hypothetical protein [Candidatus Lokiarchaeota archaeon]